MAAIAFAKSNMQICGFEIWGFILYIILLMWIRFLYNFTQERQIKQPLANRAGVLCHLLHSTFDQKFKSKWQKQSWSRKFRKRKNKQSAARKPGDTWIITVLRRLSGLTRVELIDKNNLSIEGEEAQAEDGKMLKSYPKK